MGALISLRPGPPLLRAVGLALALTLVTALTRAAAPLRWGADAEGGAPYVFHDPADPAHPRGFEVDIAALLARELGRDVVHVQYEYVSLLAGLERGDIDLAMNGLEVTPDRAQQVRFSRSYYVFREQLSVRRGDPRCATLAACITSAGTIATLGDTFAERLLDARGAHKKIYDGQVEPYSELALGRVDAVLLDLPIALYAGRSDPRVAPAELLPERGEYAIALRPGDEALARSVDRALDSLAQRGELERVYRRWGLWNDDQLAPRAAQGEALAASSRDDWTWREYLPLLLRAGGVTLWVSVLSMALAIVLALPIALARVYGPRPLRWAAIAYVELLRGVPVLLLLYFLYYGLPTLGVRLGPLTAAVLGFGCNYAAYEAEIYRAALAAVPQAQRDAAASLGLSPRLTLRHVVLPQALRLAIPPITNDFVALFKDTSLVSVIAVVELTKQYQILAKSTFRYLELGLATALLYLALSLPVGAFARRLERRIGRGQA